MPPTFGWYKFWWFGMYIPWTGHFQGKISVTQPLYDLTLTSTYHPVWHFLGVGFFPTIPCFRLCSNDTSELENCIETWTILFLDQLIRAIGFCLSVCLCLSPCLFVHLSACSLRNASNIWHYVSRHCLQTLYMHSIRQAFSDDIKIIDGSTLTSILSHWMTHAWAFVVVYFPQNTSDWNLPNFCSIHNRWAKVMWPWFSKLVRVS